MENLNHRMTDQTKWLTAALAVLLALAVGSARATTVLSTSGSDSWNTGIWSAGIPSGTVDAEIADGIAAGAANAATPGWSGKLTLGVGSSLLIGNVGGSDNALTGATNIVMKTGSKIAVNINANLNYGPITLLGDATIESPFGASDHQTDNLAAITGTYKLTINGFNNHTWNLNATNTFSELALNTIDRYNIRAKAAKSLGGGDVRITPRSDGRSARLYLDVADTMADTATLYLNGTAGQGGYAGNGIDWIVVAAGVTEIVAGVQLYGVPLAPGTYSGGASTTDWIGGSGSITVVPITPKNPSPAFGVVVPAGTVVLRWTNLDPTTGSNVWVDVWFGTNSTALAKVVSAGLNTTNATVSAPVAATYYWRVDSYLDGAPTGTPVTGTLFNFVVTDTDGDGFPDSYELAHTTPPSNTALNPGDDLDSDGLTNWQEYQLGTDPTLADTDGDGLADGAELTGVGSRPPTDPLLPDTDGDGLNDGVESNTGMWVGPTNTGTDPTVVDTDSDGLRDGVESNTGAYVSPTNTGTHPLVMDSDGDGAGDWYEVAAAFTNPNSNSSKPNIPYPLPKPNSSTGATNKPVKVFILSGQSNMVGFGNVGGTSPGTLDTVVKREGKFPNLLDTNGNWSVRNDLLYKGVISDTWTGSLTVADSAIGPELGFGHVMGYYYDEPVLLIKASIGNRSLGWDYLPPGSPQFTNGSTVYPGYGGYGTWPVGGQPPTNGTWYAGREYDDCFLSETNWSPTAAPIGFTNPVVNVVDVLDNFGANYPQWAAQGFQIAGYLWWQGNKDIGSGSPYTDRYETNLVQFIKQIRAYYANRYPGKCSTNTPFVLATGCGDPQTNGNGLVVANAQLAASDPAKHPEFAGNVKTMDIRGYWRDASISPGNAGYHYNLNAETYMLTGDALGRGMMELLIGTNLPPAAAFTAGPTNGLAPLTVTFTDTSTGTITNRFWDFGDGGTTNTTVTNLTYTYAGTGPYTVALIVSGASGVSTNTKPNYINVAAVPAIPPLAPDQFGFDPGTGTATFQIVSTNGLQYCIKYNADLLNTNGWTLLDPPGWTNGTTGVTITLQDTTAAGATQRFYKVEAKAVDAP